MPLALQELAQLPLVPQPPRVLVLALVPLLVPPLLALLAPPLLALLVP